MTDDLAALHLRLTMQMLLVHGHGKQPDLLWLAYSSMTSCGKTQFPEARHEFIVGFEM